MTDFAYFVIAWLPPNSVQPFLISSVLLSTGGKHRIYASLPMSQVGAMLIRWRVAAVHQCLVHTEVVFAPVDDPFGIGASEIRE
jgi:hypothetical protein